MLRLDRAFAALVTATLVGLAVPAAAAPDKDRYIVVLVDAADPDRVADEHRSEHGADPSHIFRTVLKGYAAEIPDGRVHALSRDPRVLYVEREPEATISAQTLPSGVDRMDAEKNAIARIDGVDDRVDIDVAVVDTGIDIDHPDLNVVASTNCLVGGLLGSSCSGSGDDDQGHGSHVAGSIAAKDNTIGVVGVAPGARLHAVKVLDATGTGTGGSILAGLDWVAARSSTIEVVNMSLGGDGYFKAEHDAVKNLVSKGIVVVVAAGNEARDVYGPDGVFGNSDDTSPADFPEAMTISALADFDGMPGGRKDETHSFSICTESKDDSTACYTNFSRSVVSTNPVTSPGGAIDLMLPGTDIYSTYLNGGYTSMSGTSMASPHAAGLVATYIAANGRATNSAGVAAIRQALINAAQPQTSVNGLTTHDDPDPNKEGLGWGTGWPGSGTGGGTSNNPPTAGFSHSCSGLTCAFTDTSTDSDGSVVAWSWNFGDGTTSTSQHPAKTYSASGTYTVSLTVTDNAGGTASTTRSVTTGATGDPDPATPTLSNGVARSDTNAGKGTWKYYKIQVPSGRSQLKVELTGPACGLLGCNPDLDLYVLKGAKPSLTSYTCKAATGRINETCTIASPGADWWYIGVYQYGGTATVTYSIKATY